MPRWLFLVGLALWAPVVASTAAQASSIHPQSARALIVLKPRFTVVGTTPVSTNGRYTFFRSASGPSGTLLDEQTGRRQLVPSAPSCDGPGPPMMGGQWVMFPCPSGFELYAVPNGPWHAVGLSPRIQSDCDQFEYPGECYAVAVGTDWLEINKLCYHCLPDYVFQNLQSGEVRSDPTGGSTIPDLNSPSLARRLCSPVTVPNVIDGGWVIPVGRFALAFQAPNTEAYGSWFVQRCGTRLRRPLPYRGQWYNDARNHSTIASSPRMVIWAPPPFSVGQPQLEGIYLPTLRRFVVTLPASVTQVDSLALSATHLYLHSSLGSGHSWAAVLPSKPPSHR